jgi:hypothetical protein
MDQLPQRCGRWLKDGKEPVQVLGQFGARLDARAGAQQPQRGVTGSGGSAADGIACLERAGGLYAEPAGDRCGGQRRVCGYRKAAVVSTPAVWGGDGQWRQLFCEGAVSGVSVGPLHPLRHAYLDSLVAQGCAGPGRPWFTGSIIAGWWPVHCAGWAA